MRKLVSKPGATETFLTESFDIVEELVQDFRENAALLAEVTGAYE